MGLGPPPMISRLNPARGRVVTTPKYFCTRFWAKKYIIWVKSVLSRRSRNIASKFEHLLLQYSLILRRFGHHSMVLLRRLSCCSKVLYQGVLVTTVRSYISVLITTVWFYIKAFKKSL